MMDGDGVESCGQMGSIYYLELIAGMLVVFSRLYRVGLRVEFGAMHGARR